jgi:ribosomal protein S18 acetylase RimI-like enzyme
MRSDILYIEKSSTINEIFDSLQNELAPFPHWYLTLLAVDPSHQGKGYASILLREKLREIDKQNLPCFLNTQNESNLSVYEHFGFELRGKIKVPKANFYYYGMLREKKK